jgi:uncharacterized protein (TIGR02266 family)
MQQPLRKSTAPRVFFDEPVELTVKGSESALRGRALNLSTGGIFICTDVGLPEGCRVEVRFGVPGGGGVCVEATVLRSIALESESEPTGLALRFDSAAPEDRTLIESFVEQRLQPGAGEPVRLQLGELGYAITARACASFGNFVSVDADLGFLRLGSPVLLQSAESGAESTGAIRWVSIHVPPETGVPRINIGIELGAGPDPGAFDEELDPVCSAEFSEHSLAFDREVRAQVRGARPLRAGPRRRGVAPRRASAAS